MPDLSEHVETLRHLTRTDPDPRVRHRADALLLVAQGHRVEAAAHALGCSAKRVRAWRQRFLAEGRDGLADRPRPGRPPALGGAAWQVLQTALTESPLDHGYPVTTWPLADLRDLLARHGWEVCPTTVARTLHARGYRYRRPRTATWARSCASAGVTCSASRCPRVSTAMCTLLPRLRL